MVKWKTCNRLVLFALLGFIAISINAQRPKIGLTLSGGGAKGLAHIGVLKVERLGNTFTSSLSANGSSWTTISTVNISMASAVKIGLCVTSHSDGNLSTVTFDNVTLTGSLRSGPDLEVSIDSPLSSAPESKFRIYPNPVTANGTITIEGVNGSNIIVYSPSGAIESKFEVSQEQLQTTLNLKSGVYFMVVQEEGTVETVKLIVR